MIDTFAHGEGRGRFVKKFMASSQPILFPGDLLVNTQGPRPQCVIEEWRYSLNRYTVSYMKRTNPMGDLVRKEESVTISREDLGAWQRRALDVRDGDLVKIRNPHSPYFWRDGIVTGMKDGWCSVMTLSREPFAGPFLETDLILYPGHQKFKEEDVVAQIRGDHPGMICFAKRVWPSMAEADSRMPSAACSEWPGNFVRVTKHKLLPILWYDSSVEHREFDRPDVFSDEVMDSEFEFVT